MRAICNECQNEFSWYGGRGRKLVDVLSPCCRASAHGVKANRTPSSKAAMPKKRVMVQRVYGSGDWFDIMEWWTPVQATIYLRPDGLVEFSYPVGSRGWKFKVMGVASDSKGGGRVFMNDDDTWKSFRRISEEDYQDLLKRGQK